MSSPDVPDLRRGGLLGLLITGSLWLKLFVGGSLVILGALSLRDEPRTALLRIAFGMAVGFPAALWLRRDSLRSDAVSASACDGDCRFEGAASILSAPPAHTKPR